jgi:hypothetical protein
MKLRQSAKQFVMRRGYVSVQWRLCEGGRGLYVRTESGHWYHFF